MRWGMDGALKPQQEMLLQMQQVEWELWLQVMFLNLEELESEY